MKLFRNLLKCFPRLAMAYRHVRDYWRGFELAKPTPMGFLFAGPAAMCAGEFEPGETILIEKILSRVDVFINIGANVGYYVCLALKNRKYSVAFEPVPANVRRLLRNIIANQGQELVEVFPVALGKRQGVVNIYGGGTGASIIPGYSKISETYVDYVPCLSFDQVVGDRFNGKKVLIVIDVEGAEGLCLEGASQFLKHSSSAVFMIEITILENQPEGQKHNPHALAVFETMWAAGYQSYTAAIDPRKVTRNHVMDVIEGRRDSLKATNFLFFREDDSLSLMNVLREGN
jgi:FkbM family methyltransferase